MCLCDRYIFILLQLLNSIMTNDILIIKGSTGCGKTTQVPQFILDACVEKRVHCNIIVTQPRKIAAISVAKRVCAERNWEVGTIVGYQVCWLISYQNIIIFFLLS